MSAEGRHGALPPAVARVLDRVLAGHRLDRAGAIALIDAGPSELPAVLDAAAAARDAGKGGTVTYSRKVFLPLTNLCRDDCGYCTFKRDPGQPGAHTMSLEEVLAVCEAGARLGCKEALLSLGDKPEARFPEHREWLRRRGFRTTLEYVRAACEAIVRYTPLLPHANPGLMSEGDLLALRDTNVSVGLMLESAADRLTLPGGPHHRAPDKVPRRRLRTLEAAGRIGIAFTTGILIGIGETRAERVDALLAIREVHARYGHVQEVIIQNFRAKPGIPMARHPEPDFDELRRTIAIARLLFGPAMNVQAPPNLSPGMYPALIAAGLNDWGGISPLTIDYINPEAPWPHVEALARATAVAGGCLRERLAIYPEFIGRPGFVPELLRPRVATYVDETGLVSEPAAVPAAEAGGAA
ncbi:MAG: 7,8-didemethyl-8-hydroxy-5-deazariboflavin synthase CofG [Candidatus Rokubacteria bacterium]|nr:7,8-didemethyl-8-hydroxy-5-deazariboflavin synthase CofG [Candidatus Rokubacteria bacterium]